MTRVHKTVCVLILTAFLLGCALAGGTKEGYSVRAYSVAPGDTLWRIAEENKPAGMDVRAYVRLIKQINGAGCRLWPGQGLMLPVWEE